MIAVQKALMFCRSNNVYDNIVLYMFLHLLGNIIFPANHLGGGLLCLFSICMIVYSIFKYGKFIYPFKGLSSLLYASLVFLIVFCIFFQSYALRNDSKPWGNDFMSLLSFHIVVQGYILAYFVPFFILFNYKRFSLFLFIKLSPCIALIGIGHFIYNINTIVLKISLFNKPEEILFSGEQYSIWFSCVSFCLFLSPYIKNKKIIVPIVLFAVCALITTIVYARRGSTLSIVLVLIIASLINFKSLLLWKKIMLIFSLFIGIFFVVENLNINSIPLFNNILDKGLTNTREGEEYYFKKDLFNSSDIIFGRGLYGTYYRPQYLRDSNGRLRFSEKRNVIETGFYNLILKGGIIFACIYVLLLLGAVYRGLFFSKNNVVKLFSIWILLYLFELYPFGHCFFSVKFLLIWIGVCICYNNIYRNLSDKQICALLRIS